MIENLSSISPNVEVSVTGYSDNVVANRLIALGLVPQKTIVIKRFSPLKDAMYIKCGPSQVAIRMSEAAHVLVSRSIINGKS